MGVSRRKTFEVRYVEDAGRIQVFIAMYHHSRVTTSWVSSPMPTGDVQRFLTGLTLLDFFVIFSYSALYMLSAL